MLWWSGCCAWSKHYCAAHTHVVVVLFSVVFICFLRGELIFHYEGKPEWDNHCHIFTCADHQWEGELRETEEMKPMWWNVVDIPYNDMWADDIIWYATALHIQPQAMSNNCKITV